MTAAEQAGGRAPRHRRATGEERPAHQPADSDRAPRAPLAAADVRAKYDRAAAGYDRAHGEPGTAARDRAIDAAQLAAAAAAARLLEIGCGTGRLLGRAATPTRVGIDLSPAMLARARARGIAAAVADAHRLPFADESFDAILAGKGVFRYLDAPLAFAECARVLAPGGRLAVHQYSAVTWGPRSAWRRARSRSAPAPAQESWHIRDLRQLIAPAAAAGLALRAVHLFRSLPVYPHVVKLPAWAPAALWSQCVVVFARPPG